MANRVALAPAAAVESRDQLTRQRLFEAGIRLFAEQGFTRVTVRQLAEAARANVAAVNYHFGDKAGLYHAVVNRAIDLMQETNALALEAGAGLDPRGQLRAYIRVFLTRMTASRDSPWIHRLIHRELDDPTEALTRILHEVIEPRNLYVSQVIAALTDLPADDPRVSWALASIQGQLLIFVRPLPAAAPEPWKHIASNIEGVVDHITLFSLGGLSAIRG